MWGTMIVRLDAIRTFAKHVSVVSFIALVTSGLVVDTALAKKRWSYSGSKNSGPAQPPASAQKSNDTIVPVPRPSRSAVEKKSSDNTEAAASEPSAPSMPAPAPTVAVAAPAADPKSTVPPAIGLQCIAGCYGTTIGKKQTASTAISPLGGAPGLEPTAAKSDVSRVKVLRGSTRTKVYSTGQ